MTTTATPPIICQWFALCENAPAGVVEHPILGNVPTCQRCVDKLDLKLIPCVVCPTCAMHGFLSCRETVGTCDLCGKRGDVYMDYCHSGDREAPDETVCLECMITGHHIQHAHEE